MDLQHRLKHADVYAICLFVAIRVPSSTSLPYSFFSDLTRNPMIVPLKILRGHGVKGGLGVLASEFHPRQPWLFTAGMDGVVNMFQDV